MSLDSVERRAGGMNERKSVLAVGAHADDVEFQMAGTLSLLAEAGFEPHIMTIAKCDLDSNETSREEMIKIRDQEARRSAAVIGAVYHPAIVPDMMIFYEDRLLRKVAAVVREVQPTIVLLPSLNDYMEDHMNTARLVVSACFVHAMRNYFTDPPRDMTTQDMYLYHAQPHSNRDGMRQFVIPELFVDIATEIDVKLKMLACYESQWKWLKETQGMDSFLDSMRRSCAELASKAPRKDIEYAEGFRQHNYIGFSVEDGDPLSHTLRDKVLRNH
jgi:LmbE family N-acetylglucosaminyl deacetylase